MKKIWKPAVCHGIGKARFEGWYYKIVDRPKKHSFAIIPGFSSGEPAQAFIQIFDGLTNQYNFVSYPLEEFTYHNEFFEVSIGENYFSQDKIKLGIENQQLQIEGEISFSNHIPWPVTRFTPGAMGPFAFLPRMECSHGVLSFNPKVSGKLFVDSSPIIFDGGKGYIEKDWGRSFPQAWIWMQSNHFSDENISFMASIAKIKYLGQQFTGFLAGFLLNGELYLFSSYNRTKLEHLIIKDNYVSFTLRKGMVKINVEADQRNKTRIKGPVSGKMIGKVLESLTSSISIDFADSKKRLEYKGIGDMAGLEIMGQLKDFI